MSDDVKARIARYIDGVATAKERAALERALIDDEVARLFAEEMLLRDLLRRAPPDVTPAEVIARSEAAVLGELMVDDEEVPGWFTQALDAVGWSIRGSAMPFRAAGLEPARMGWSTLRHGMPVSREAPRKPWWRRALGWRRK